MFDSSSSAECATVALTLVCVDPTFEMLGPPGPPPAHKGSRNARVYGAAKAPKVVCGCLNQGRPVRIYPGTRIHAQRGETPADARVPLKTPKVSVLEDLSENPASVASFSGEQSKKAQDDREKITAGNTIK